MISLCKTLLPNGRVHAIPAVIGKAIKPIPITDRVIEVDVVPVIGTESTDSKIVLSVFYFLYFFFFIYGFFWKYVIISLMLLVRLLKLFLSLNFLSKLCS